MASSLDYWRKRKLAPTGATTKPSAGRKQNVKLKIENVKLRRRRRRRLHNSTFYILHSQFYTLQPCGFRPAAGHESRLRGARTSSLLLRLFICFLKNRTILIVGYFPSHYSHLP